MMRKEDINTDAISDVIRLCLFGLLFLGFALWIQWGGSHHYIDLARRWTLRLSNDPSALHRMAGLLLFVAVGGLLISLGLPRIWFSAAAGAVCGVTWGVVVAVIASLGGAAVLFWVGRSFLSGMVRRRTAGKMARWRSGLQKNAFWWVLYLRLFPFANCTLTSLLCGSCRIRFSAYVSASLIGFLPYTIMFAAFGHGGFHGNVLQILFGFALLGATIIVRKWLPRIHPDKPGLLVR